MLATPTCVQTVLCRATVHCQSTSGQVLLFTVYQLVMMSKIHFECGTAHPNAPVVCSCGVQHEVVATGWMSQTDFLTGLALIQALPGPLFNLAAYVGACAVSTV